MPADGLAQLRAAGAEVVYEPDLKGDSLVDAVRTSGAEVLVVRSTEVGAAALRAGRLGLVVRAGAGYNTIDVKTASELGIYVSNCPGRNSVAVAELAIALLLALDRRVVDGAVDLRRGVWSKKEYGQAQGLFGRTLGIVGTGSIGREVAARGRVPNCVNIARRTPATHLLVVRHRDRVGVLAHVFGRLKEAGINAQQTENVVFDGAAAAMARIQVEQAPAADTLEAIRAGCADVLDLKLVEIPQA